MGMKLISVIQVVLVVLLIDSCTNKLIKTYSNHDIASLIKGDTIKIIDSKLDSVFGVEGEKTNIGTTLIYKDTFNNKLFILCKNEPANHPEWITSPNYIVSISVMLVNQKNIVTYLNYFATKGNGGNCNVIKLADNRLVAIHISESMGGWTDENIELYAFVHKKFKKVLNIDDSYGDNCGRVEENSPEYYNYETTFEVVPGSYTILPQMRAIKKGTIEEKKTKKVVPINKIDTFIFNSSKEMYELSKVSITN